VTFLDGSQAMLSVGACTALAEMCRRGPLPLPDEAKDGLSKLSLAEKLINKVQSSKESNKVRNQIIFCVILISLCQSR
jgi:hypothetical protein